MPLFSQPLIGLDIRPHKLTLIQTRKTRHGFQVERAMTAAVPGDLFDQGKIRHWETLKLILHGLVQQCGLRGIAAAIHMPATQVRTRQIQLPEGLPDAEIEAEIHAQIQRDLPGMSEALCMDFVVLQAGEGYVNVFSAAARQEYLMNYVHCVNASGLRVKIVDVDTHALVRAVNYAYGSDETDYLQGIFHADSDTATLAVYNRNEVIFHAHWSFSDTPDFSVQLNNQLRLCRAALGKNRLQRLSVCCGLEQRELFCHQAAALAVETHCPDLFARLKSCLTDGDRQLLENLPEYLLACGLAMREVPRW
jgi:Tfp pilus assembly PilM family ATPase